MTSRAFCFRSACCVILSFCFSRSPRQAHAQGGFTQVWQRGDESPVNDVLVDRDGFIYTAGEKGICRYDGRRTTCIRSAPATLIAQGPDHDLWVVYKNGEIENLATLQKFRLPEMPTAIATAENVVVLGTRHGLFVLDKSADHTGARPLGSGDVGKIVALGGNAFACLVDHNLVKLDAQTGVVQNRSESAGAPVDTLALGSAGSLITAFGHTVWKHASGSSNAEMVLSNADLRLPILSVAEGSDLTMWLGASGSLYQWQASSGKLVDVKGLPFQTSNFAVHAIAIESSNRLWLGTTAGLIEVRQHHPLRILGRRTGYDVPIAFAVATKDKEAWFSFGSGAANLSTSGLRLFDARHGLPIPDIRGVTVDGEGHVWAAGMQSGLFKLDEAAGLFHKVGILRELKIQALFPRRLGGILISLATGEVCEFVNGTLTILVTNPQDGDHVIDLLEGADATLWLAYEKRGLVAIRSGKAIPIALPEFLPDFRPMCLLEDGAGGILIGTMNAGLVRSFEGRFSFLRSSRGLPDNSIYGMVTDNLGRLWWSSASGLHHAPLSELLTAFRDETFVPHIETWAAGQGLRSELIRGFAKSADKSSQGHLFFPTLDGLLEVDANAVLALTPIKVAISDVVINGTAFFAHNVPQAIDHGAQIAVHFGAPSATNAENLKFQYRMLDHDEAWRAEDKIGEALFVGVPAGRHRFQVRAVCEPESHRGQLCEAAEMTLLVKPPWYGSWTFRFASVLLAAGAIAVGWRRRSQWLARMEGARLAERRRIAADMHDGLSQDLAGLALQLDAALMTLDPGAAHTAGYLRRAVLLVADCLSDLRDSIWQQHHDSVTSLHLVDGLKARLERATDGTATRLQFDSSGTLRAIPGAVAWPLVQIVREAVANAIKHGRADKVTVRLHFTSQHLTMAVEDNGVGVTAAGHGVQHTGVGLAGIRARVSALGGEFRVEDAPAGGTRLFASIPCRI